MNLKIACFYQIQKPTGYKFRKNAAVTLKEEGVFIRLLLNWNIILPGSLNSKYIFGDNIRCATVVSKLWKWNFSIKFSTIQVLGVMIVQLWQFISRFFKQCYRVIFTHFLKIDVNEEHRNIYRQPPSPYFMI